MADASVVEAGAGARYRASGVLIALGPLAAGGAAQFAGGVLSPPWIEMASLAAAGSLVAYGGWMLPGRPRRGRWLAALGLTSAMMLALPGLMRSPAETLLVALAAGWVLHQLFTDVELSRMRARTRRVPASAPISRLRAASLVALAGWFIVVPANVAAGWQAWTGAAIALAAAWVFAIRWAWLDRGERARLWAMLAASALGLAALLAGHWQAMLSCGAAGVGFALLLARPRSGLTVERASIWELVLEHPARLLVVTFLLLCGAGTILLALPLSSSSGRSVGLLDAGFTAVSAVCVTGLIVLDTPHAFSGMGQALILLLIQLGGLGIMTFSTAVLGLVGRRLSLRHEGSMAVLVSGDRATLYRSLRLLLVFTFGLEALGAAILAPLFAWHGDHPLQALWRGVFTSISAFCNAGFALQTDSLIGYQADPLAAHTVAALIVLGGLSPGVALAIPAVARGGRVPVQARLALTVTAALLIIGALLYGAIEWQHTLAHLSLADRVHNAWFQSVTLRTAGFNTVDIAAVQPASLVIMVTWMFVGGCPGGTAGGVKVTTAGVLLLAVVGAIRGRPEARAFGRRIPHATVYKAAAITTVGLLSAAFAVLAILLTQNLPVEMALFEVISALGTVGLSLGATPLLDGVGKVVIMAAMFAGRVGPLTLFLLLGSRTDTSVWEVPEEQVDVG